MLASSRGGGFRWWQAAALVTTAVAAAAGGCAKGTVEFEAPGTGPSSTAGSGGSSGTGGSGGHGGMPVALPCGVDCATIKAGDCHVAQCNMATKQCEVVAQPDGQSCQDGKFCTIHDSCKDGQCVGGDPNTCAATVPICSEIVCDEDSKTCSTSPLSDLSACTDPKDLCIVNGQCQGGQCLGTHNNCDFAPVPDDCHVAECNPANGQCEPVPGNDNKACTDLTDLCTIGKTCMNGTCIGGTPKNCSAFTKGCTLGVCDTADGTCKAKPVKDGDPCDDLDACTSGEICSAGKCGGGALKMTCLSGDGCCPAGCTQANDDDCGCNVNLAKTATPLNSGGGQDAFGYGPKNLNDGVNEAGCMAKGCNACFCWIANSNAAGGAWVEYDWAAPQTIGSIHVDAKTCAVNCSANGRTMFSGKAQWWDGAQWQTAQSFTGIDGDLKMTFVPKLKTTKLRLFDVAAAVCQQDNNTLIYEWGVYSGANCSLP